jgi:tetratricopeptide (TPR) repeat protein
VKMPTATETTCPLSQRAKTIYLALLLLWIYLPAVQSAEVMSADGSKPKRTNQRYPAPLQRNSGPERRSTISSRQMPPSRLQSKPNTSDAYATYKKDLASAPIENLLLEIELAQLTKYERALGVNELKIRVSKLSEQQFKSFLSRVTPWAQTYDVLYSQALARRINPLESVSLRNVVWYLNTRCLGKWETAFLLELKRRIPNLSSVELVSLRGWVPLVSPVQQWISDELEDRKAAKQNRPAELFQRGKFAESEEALRKRIAQELKTHPNSIVTAQTLESAASSVRDKAVAEQMFNQAISIRSRVQPNTEEFAKSLARLADFHSRQKQQPQAMEFYKKALSVEERVNPHSSECIRLMRRIAETATEMQDYKTAEPEYRKAIDITERAMGTVNDVDVTDLISLLNALGKVYLQQRSYSPADEVFHRALALCDTVQPATNVPTSVSLSNSMSAHEVEAVRQMTLQASLLRLRKEIIDNIAAMNAAKDEVSKDVSPEESVKKEDDKTKPSVSGNDEGTARWAEIVRQGKELGNDGRTEDCARFFAKALERKPPINIQREIYDYLDSMQQTVSEPRSRNRNH